MSRGKLGETDAAFRAPRGHLGGGRRTDGAGRDRVVLRCPVGPTGREVLRERKVSSERFAHAVKLFGYEGVVNLAALMGNYAATAIMFNAVYQHLHPDRQPLLPLP